MHIDANGNILVGNSGTTPSTTMDVFGSLTVQQDAQSNGGDVFFKDLPSGHDYNYQAVMVDTTNGKLYRMSSDDGWGGSLVEAQFGPRMGLVFTITLVMLVLELTTLKNHYMFMEKFPTKC